MKKDMEANKTVRFKNLSWPLKTIVVFGWLNLIYFTVLMLIGFVIGFAGAI